MLRIFRNVIADNSIPFVVFLFIECYERGGKIRNDAAENPHYIIILSTLKIQETLENKHCRNTINLVLSLSYFLCHTAKVKPMVLKS